KNTYESLKASQPQLKGIFHAAGILEDSLLAKQTWDSFAHVMQPKIIGAWNLHNISKDLDLDFFVMFSSQAALLGNVGQANYAAVNSFMDKLAYYRKSLSKTALSINWGPWSEVGMAANMQSSEDAATGVHGISNNSGLTSLNALLADAKLPQVGVLD